MSLISTFWPPLKHPWTPRTRIYPYFIRAYALSYAMLILGVAILAIGSLLTATVWALPFGLPLIVAGLKFIFPALPTSIAVTAMCAFIIVGLPVISGIFAAVKTFWDLKFDPSRSVPKSKAKIEPQNVTRSSIANPKAKRETPELKKLNDEQEDEANEFINDLMRDSGVKSSSPASTAVLSLQNKLADYAGRFQRRYRDLIALENSQVLTNQNYLDFKEEITQAENYLTALVKPAAALDAAGSSGAENDIKTKARALLLVCAPDRNQGKGSLVEALSTEFMKVMILYKSKLLVISDNEKDIYGLLSFYKRHNEMVEAVNTIHGIKEQMWSEFENKIPHATDIIPVFDENKITTLIKEFESHLRAKKNNGEISPEECEETIAIFGFYCLYLRESLRVAQREIDVLIKGPKLEAQLETKDAELQTKEVTAKKLRIELINTLFTNTMELVESKRLSADEPTVIKLKNIHDQENPSHETVLEINNELDALFLEKGLIQSLNGESSTKHRVSYQGYHQKTDQSKVIPQEYEANKFSLENKQATHPI